MNLEAMLVCWSNHVLILKQCLTFECLLKWSWKQPCLIILWHHQNHVFIHLQVVERALLQSVISRSLILSGNLGCWTCVGPISDIWSLILSVGFCPFNVYCSNWWYLDRWFFRWHLGRLFLTVCGKPLNTIHMVCSKAVLSITSTRNFSVTL